MGRAEIAERLDYRRADPQRRAAAVDDGASAPAHPAGGPRIETDQSHDRCVVTEMREALGGSGHHTPLRGLLRAGVHSCVAGVVVHGAVARRIDLYSPGIGADSCPDLRSPPGKVDEGLAVCTEPPYATTIRIGAVGITTAHGKAIIQQGIHHRSTLCAVSLVTARSLQNDAVDHLAVSA